MATAICSPELFTTAPVFDKLKALRYRLGKPLIVRSA
jgi:hypothetical protein